MTDPEGENLDQIYRALRWNGVELAAQRIVDQARAALESLNAQLAHERQVETLAAVVPDETERAAYLTAAGGDHQHATTAATYGIPPDLLAAYPDMPVRCLALLATEEHQ